MSTLSDPAFWLTVAFYYLMPPGMSRLIITMLGALSRIEWKLGWIWLASINILNAFTVPPGLPMLIGSGASLATALWLLFRDRRRRDKARKLIGDKSRQLLEAMKREMEKMRPRVLQPVPQGAW